MAERVLALLGALYGAAGVAAMAASAHGGAAPTLGYAAQMLLAHAAALVAVAGAIRSGLVQCAMGRLAGTCIALGVALFSADVALRAFGLAERLFPMAAPSGGVLTMVGWIILGLAALLASARRGG